VQHGEVVGIIGRNGAGKSTLLKILSRITEPTSGRVVMNGRVASLLEVGTGFHPELTGRENIYLNGAMLGMHRHEIKRKFDAIVDFSGIETFLDTPVKRYSSGMYVRLAFAVAAHLDPEILIIDEVLAVGDAEFQKKCLGKMQDVARSGRTVLFVSHNLPALMNLCSRSVLLEAGAMKDSGPTELIIQRYLQTVMSVSRRSLSEWHHRQGNQEVVFTCFDIRDELGNSIDVIQSGQPVVFVFGFRCCDAALGKKINVGIGVHSSNGERLTVLYSEHTGDVLEPVTRTGEFHLRVDRFPFNPGRYFMFARIEVDGNEADFPLDGVGSFDVVAGNYYGTGRQTVDRSWAPFLLDGQWLISRPMGERELIP
jgi:lipopolysaccharide transport system ATP-binding protein